MADGSFGWRSLVNFLVA